MAMASPAAIIPSQSTGLALSPVFGSVVTAGFMARLIVSAASADPAWYNPWNSCLHRIVTYFCNLLLGLSGTVLAILPCSINGFRCFLTVFLSFIHLTMITMEGFQNNEYRHIIINEITGEDLFRDLI